MSTKRGQMELMGLAIIVILVVLGLLFAIKMTSKPKVVQGQDYVDMQLATGFLNTLLETGVPECKSQMKELMIDCARGSPMITCAVGPVSKTSCELAKQVTGELLASTLSSWGKKYSYSLKLDAAQSYIDAQLDTPITRGCTQSSNRRSRSFFLPTSRGTLTVKLDICTDAKS